MVFFRSFLLVLLNNKNGRKFRVKQNNKRQLFFTQTQTHTYTNTERKEKPQQNTQVNKKRKGKKQIENYKLLSK